MPNHIQNRLQFSGSKKAIKRLRDSISCIEDGKEIAIDFNKIVPCPDGMNINSDSWLMPLNNQFASGTPFKSHMDDLRNRIIKNKVEDGTLENFIQGIRNYVKHGHATWYSWNVANWGTKWNAYGQPDKRNTDDTIFFETAWSSPKELIQELSNQFPDVTIRLSYADEDSGCNTGILTFLKGETINQIRPKNSSNEAYELFFELHPDDRENYELIDGKYQYKESE